MARQSIQILIPLEYTENDKKGLCRVCGKSVKNHLENIAQQDVN